jgi:hypothetical protein
MTPAQDAIDGLYGLPLDEFTRARDELVRRAKQEGDAALAAEVKQLRKPSVPAWVVNQLARGRELDVQRLLNAGEQLEVAQREAIRAQSGDAFLDARRDQQHALEALAAAAKEILAAAGRGGAALDRVVATLRAGSLTEEGRALLKQGRLTEELEPPGFEALAGFDIPAKPAGPRPVAKKRPAPAPAAPEEPKHEPAAEARRRARELQRELRGLESRTAAAERRAAQMRAQLEDAEAKVSELDAQRRAAEQELDQLTVDR